MEGVREVFVVDNPLPCLPGVNMKMTGHFTHGCPQCVTEYGDEVREHYGV